MGRADVLIQIYVLGIRQIHNNIKITKARLQGKNTKNMEDEFEITARFFKTLFLKSLLYLTIIIICVLISKYIINIFITSVIK